MCCFDEAVALTENDSLFISQPEWMMESVTHKKAFLGLPSGGKYLLNYVFNLCRSLEISLVILIPNLLSSYTT